jgi:hypothetical protein
LLFVDVDYDGGIDPLRPIHFASALNVSAYSRNARRAISIAFACFGS